MISATTGSPGIITTYTIRYVSIEVDYVASTKNHYVKDGGIWKPADPLYVRDAGVWKDHEHYVKDAGIWKKVYG